MLLVMASTELSVFRLEMGSVEFSKPRLSFIYSMIHKLISNQRLTTILQIKPQMAKVLKTSMEVLQPLRRLALMRSRVFFDRN